jgi:hypothetical protein
MIKDKIVYVRAIKWSFINDACFISHEDDVNLCAWFTSWDWSCVITVIIIKILVWKWSN